MADLAMPAVPSSSPPARRIAAVGVVRQSGGRTYTFTATPTGAAGSIRPSGTCRACAGRSGRVEDTSSGGVTRKSWRRCAACDGTGGTR